MEPRYRIIETIGRGGMGEVCLADDLMLDRQVAVKFVNATGEGNALEQLLGEARAAAALDHPFICSIYEVTTLAERPCIVMEYVRGESLEHRLRAGPLAMGEALRIADEIAEALEAAHKRRVVHRDLKPANVMLTEDGHIKVMDFGLATRLPDAGSTAAFRVPGENESVRGTPAYMAPERIRGNGSDRRSDIFAFGVLLHEILSGKNPFVRVGLEATLAAILHEPAGRLRDAAPAVPVSLDGLVSRLLAKDPAARYQSFGDVRAALRHQSGEFSVAAFQPAPVAADRPARDASARLIGRDVERGHLLQSVADAKAGRGSFTLLLGDAGIGKTRLAEEAMAEARDRGYQTLVGRCYEQEGTPPLIPFIEILEEAWRLMPPLLFRESVGGSAPELARLMPELLRMFPDMAAPLELPPQLRQRFLFTNIRDFLVRSSQHAPLMIFVDDLQWADESTLQLTQHLAAQLSAHSIVMLAACRDAEPAAPGVGGRGRLHSLLDRVRGQGRESVGTQTVRATLDQLVGQRHAHPLDLRPFTEQEVQAELAALGGANPPARLVQKFSEQTGGNPLFLRMVFRHVRDEGRLFDAQGRWRRDLELDEIEIPDTVRIVLERRMQRVAPETLNVLRAAAVIGPHFEADLLEAVAEVDADALVTALDEAERIRILKGPSGRRDVTWRFAHQLSRQTLAASIPQLRRQRLHLRIADAMGQRASASRVFTSGIAHHLYCAGRLADPGRTTQALITAGDAAHAVYGTEEAVRHYRRALEVAQDTSIDEVARLQVQERLADLLALLGDRAMAMEHYDALSGAHRASDAVVPQARILRKVGGLHWQAGDRGEAMTAYRQALATLGESGTDIEAAHLYQELGLAAFRSGDNQKAVEWADRSLQSAQVALAEAGTDHPDLRRAATAAIAHATNTIGVALARCGQVEEARERIERSLATSRDVGLLDVACRAYANLGVLYSSIEPQRAIDVSLTGLELASKIGAASLQSYIYANLATAYCALTDRCETEGLEAAQAAAALDRELGQLDHLAVPLVVMAQIHQCRGDLLKAQEEYREALALAEKIGEPQLILPCYDGLATIYLDRGDRVRAEEFMEKARALCERTGLDPDALLLLPFLC